MKVVPPPSNSIGDYAYQMGPRAMQAYNKKEPFLTIHQCTINAFFARQLRLTLALLIFVVSAVYFAFPPSALAMSLISSLSKLTEIDTLYNDTEKAISEGRYADGVEKAEHLVELARTYLGEESPQTIAYQHNLGFLYKAVGRFDDAEKIYLSVLNVSRKVRGEGNAEIIETLSNLANLYTAQGRYGKAEPLLKDVLRLNIDVRGENDRNTLISVNSLAFLYEKLDRHDKAEELFEKAVTISRKHLGDRDHDTLSAISNLANLYTDRKRFDKAEPLLKDTLRIRREDLGEHHPDTIQSLNSLAYFYDAKGQYDEAERLYLEDLRLSQMVLGENHPDTLRTLSNLGLLYRERHDYGSAETYLRRAFDGARAAFGADHPDTLEMESGLALVLIAAGRTEEAVRQLTEMEPHAAHFRDSQLGTLMSRTSRRSLQGHLARYETLILTLATRSRDAAAQYLGANVVLRWKGVDAERLRVLNQVIRRSGNPDLTAAADRIRILRSRLAVPFHSQNGRDGSATETCAAPVRAPAETGRLLEGLEREESALLTANPQVASLLASRLADVEAVRSRLPVDGAILLFRAFQPYDFVAGQSGKLRLAGVLIDPHHDPIVADLGDPPATIKDMYGYLTWPFVDNLAGVKRLYVVTDNILSQDAFELLPVDASGTPWLATIDIRRLETGRELLEPMSADQGRGAWVIGDVDFFAKTLPGIPPGDEVGGARTLTTRDATADTARDLPGGFQQLPFSGDEARNISEQLGRATGYDPVRLLTRSGASKAALLGIGQAPRILHLATHGFYRARTCEVDEPLLLSGVALAGATTSLQARHDGTDEDRLDGILFAHEIQDLNLDGTDLVVLSACKTAQGAQNHSEGIEGLSRALRIAGARHVLLTLTSVRDGPTAEFMQDFYRTWLAQDTSDPQAALQTVKLTWHQRGEPAEHWAPFVMIGP